MVFTCSTVFAFISHFQTWIGTWEAAMRLLNRLGEKEVKNARPDRGKFVKRLADGGGLYLQATKSGGGVNRNWIFRYEWDEAPVTARGSHRRDVGIGPLHTVGLAEARDIALKFRQQLKAGVDPLEKREEEKRERLAKMAERAKAVTFKRCAAMYLDIHSKRWKNDKHKAQWPSTLESYVYPFIGDLNVADVDVAHVTKVLNPIWHTKPETASRVQKRTENILDFARASGFRMSENPARWTGHLKQLIGPAPKDIEHHAALPFLEAPALPPTMSPVRNCSGLSARQVYP
jgi:hypothetical protein